MAYALPDLPHPSDALEAYIDGQTKEIHHGKHHAAYMAKLNAAIKEAPALRDPNAEADGRGFAPAR
jgi:Fe-Mn family superoxide dismutase